MEVRVIVYGAGGHGQVVADILLRAREQGDPSFPVGYVDDDRELWGTWHLGLEVLGGRERLETIPHDAIVLAIGDNRQRKEMYGLLRKAGRGFAVACHPSATIGEGVRIAEGCMICAGAIINPCSEIEEDCILNTGCILDHHNRLGAHVHIAPGVTMGGEVTIEEGALIGIGATVMPRCKVGAWSIVAAGAVVCEDIPHGVLAVGIPARIVRAL